MKPITAHAEQKAGIQPAEEQISTQVHSYRQQRLKFYMFGLKEENTKMKFQMNLPVNIYP